MTYRVSIFGLAVAVAVALAWWAPGDWSAEPAVLEVTYRGSQVSFDVELGDSESFEDLQHASDGVDIAVEAPDGFPLAEPIVINATVHGSSNPPQLGEISLVIVTDDSRYQVPVYDVSATTFEAARRPAAGLGIVLGLLGAAIVLWITEVVPLFVTSLIIPVVLTVSKTGSAAQSLAPFFDPIIVLFFAGFLLAEAMSRVELDKKMAVTIVSWGRGGPVRLYLILLALAAVASMWMSNTAAVAVLIPIALAVTSPLKSPSYQRATVLGIAYAATIGGVGSAIGTPANPLAISFIERLTGRVISFSEWFGFGLPMVVLFIPVMAAYVWVVSKVEVDRDQFNQSAMAATSQRASMGPISADQLAVIATFIVVAGLWVTQSWHGLSTGIAALAGVVALYIGGKLEPEDLNRISWSTLLTFGGGLVLGTFMVSTGTSDWLVTQLGGLASLPETLAIGLVALAALGLTTVASNTAAAATLIPLAVPLSGLVGVNPVVMVMVVAVASSIDFALVIGTPPTMMAHSTGLFTSKEILAKGAALDIAGVVILVVVVVPVWRALGLL